YKKTDSGWQKYTGTGGGGTWQPVQPGQNAQQARTNASGRNLSGATEGGAAARTSNLAGETERGGASRQSFESRGQLESDRAARMGGERSYQQFGAMRGGGGFGGRG